MPEGEAGIFVTDPSTGKIRSMTEEFKKVYEAGKEYFKHLKYNMKYISPVAIDDEFLRTELFSRFHTHPIDDPNYPPSDVDSYNTYIAGPNILFSQKNKKLHVYKISKGKWKEIYHNNIGNYGNNIRNNPGN
jgi:hypothetical protein